MVATDLQWFCQVLALCRNVKAAFMAGTATKALYIDDFLKKYLPPSYSLRPRAKRRKGETSVYDLVGPNLNIPVFFCGPSPSAGDGGVGLASEVWHNLASLKAAGF